METGRNQRILIIDTDERTMVMGNAPLDAGLVIAAECTDEEGKNLKFQLYAVGEREHLEQGLAELFTSMPELFQGVKEVLEIMAHKALDKHRAVEATIQRVASGGPPCIRHLCRWHVQCMKGQRAGSPALDCPPEAYEVQKRKNLQALRALEESKREDPGPIGSLDGFN